MNLDICVFIYVFLPKKRRNIRGETSSRELNINSFDNNQTIMIIINSFVNNRSRCYPRDTFLKVFAQKYLVTNRLETLLKSIKKAFLKRKKKKRRKPSQKRKKRKRKPSQKHKKIRRKTSQKQKKRRRNPSQKRKK